MRPCLRRAEGNWLTVPQTARLLGLQLHTVYGLVDRGELEAEVIVPTDRRKRRRSVRVRRQAVEDYIDRAPVEPGELHHLNPAAHLAAFPVGPEGLVLTNQKGEDIRRGRFNEVWHRAIADADLPPGPHFHDLRHYDASLLIRHGESVKVVQARLGHASATDARHYAHLWPDSEDRTRGHRRRTRFDEECTGCASAGSG